MNNECVRNTRKRESGINSLDACVRPLIILYSSFILVMSGAFDNLTLFIEGQGFCSQSA